MKNKTRNENQCVLIVGQCGYGKTSIVNRLLQASWYTCSYDTGTKLPFLKIYKKRRRGSHEFELVPEIVSRKAKVELKSGACLNRGISMQQTLAEVVRWEVQNEKMTETELLPGLSSICFVDLMGIGDGLLTENHYHQVYREFARKATHVLWVADATRRGYRADEDTMAVVGRSFVNLEKVTILLNKVDSIALERGEPPHEVPTPRQLKILEEGEGERPSKKQDVLNYIGSLFKKRIAVSLDDVIPISAKFGWDFEKIQNQFFASTCKK